MTSRKKRIKLALTTAHNPLDFVFHVGYQQFVLPRWVRRLVSGTEMHRAWLNGYHGWWIGPVMARTAWEAS